ncbi:Rv2629 family ribosome hibernation factor [Actinokineospora iranica]|uniref:Peptide chain release factor 1 (ERF1) n=1 Tax=Actinokineospora iranica TaxID=1271860 RepID=A0A1G6WNZ0_9PSEU|nr:Vms1/Ankzf1 family peptidyl-tRNA hydrolase [Actinokineospora iranica]SDD67588.1 hypothetical protein SAMN05216174_115105 [Actinokineospora iranica]
MQTTALRDLIRHPGPFASVYLDFSHDTEDALDQRRLRWRAARASLEEQGADQGTVEAIEQAYDARETAPGQVGLALIAAAGEVLLDHLMPVPPPLPETRFSALPYLLPLVAAAPKDRPYLVVVVDKVGADFRLFEPDGTVAEPGSVEGVDHPIHKVRGGGWAHLSMQHRVEETVAQNIARVAAETARLAQRGGVWLVVVGGEVQSRADLLSALPKGVARIAVEVDAGSRGAGADEDRLRVEVERAVAEFEAAEHLDVVEAYRAERGATAVDGMAAATAALREANARVVLVGPELSGSAWVSPSSPDQVAIDDDALRGLGLADFTRLPADEVVPAAAVAVGAELVAVRHEVPLSGGIGVLLRHR